MLQSARHCGRYPHTSGRYPHTSGSATPCHGEAVGLKRKKSHTRVLEHTCVLEQTVSQTKLAWIGTMPALRAISMPVSPPAGRSTQGGQHLLCAGHRGTPGCRQQLTSSSLHSAWGTSQGCMLCMIWKQGDACHQCNFISMHCSGRSPVKEMAEASGWVVR